MRHFQHTFLIDTLLLFAGKTDKEKPLFPAHEPRTPEDHPRAGRGLHCGERELRQRAQTQRRHHSPQVGHYSNSDLHLGWALPIHIKRLVVNLKICIFAHFLRGKCACPNSTLTSLIERETTGRAPPPIAHIKQHSSK